MARFVLVHGAFGRAACWDRVAPGLRAAGHDVEAVREALCHCCDDEQFAWSVSLRGHQPIAPFTHPVALGGPSADAFGALPRAYVICLQDRAIKPALQRRFIETSGCDPVIEIDTDHAVWASQPDELAAALNEIAG